MVECCLKSYTNRRHAEIEEMKEHLEVEGRIRSMQNAEEISLYRRVFILAAPIALQNIITYTVGLADNIMVGSLGDLALSGVYVANQLQSILQMLVLGLGAAMTILVTQYWGKRDVNSVKTIIGIGLKFSVSAGLVLLAATLLFPMEILRLFTNEDAVLAEAMKYLRVIRFTYVFFCLTEVLIAAMRSLEKVQIGMYVSAISLVINVFFNWVFIFGNLGAPALGVKGAAVATLISRVAVLPIMIYYVRFGNDRIQLRLQEVLQSNALLVRDFFRFGFPVILGDIFWGINLAVQGAIVGRLGAEALASVSIANVVFSIIGVAMRGATGATSVIIGQTVGAGEYEKVKEYAKKLQLLFLGIGICSGAALYAVKDYVLLFYNISPEAAVMARQFMTVLAVTIIGTSYQASALTGIVRAGGSTHFVLINDLIFVWLVVIPSALLAAFVYKAPPWVVFACLKSDQILKCFVAVVKVNRFRWMKNLTRETASA